MKRSLLLLTFALCATFFGLAHVAYARQETSESQQPGVILTKLSPPVYPPLARQAGIAGDVKIQLAIRQDGSIESVLLLSGHPMLAPAALENARHSLFECRSCNAPATTYLLTYAFEIRGDGDCCSGQIPSPEVTLTPGLVTIASAAECICDPAAAIVRVRAVKCLYLWKCGLR